MARPKAKVDGKLVQQMASWGAKNEEIASYFNCSTDTLERRFAGELRKGRVDVRMSLRQWQLQAAKKGNVVMMIWLGKQMLGQTEKIEQKTETAVKASVTFETEWGSTIEPTDKADD